MGGRIARGESGSRRIVGALAGALVALVAACTTDGGALAPAGIGDVGDASGAIDAGIDATSDAAPGAASDAGRGDAGDAANDVASGSACDGPCPPCTLSCGAGTCVFSRDTGGPICACPAGTYFHFDTCLPVAGSPCDGVVCNGGTCGMTGANAFGPSCLCAGDTILYGNACIPWSRVRCVDATGALVDKGTIRCSTDDQSFEVCRDADGDGNVEWAPSGTPKCAKGSTCSACIKEPCDSGDGQGTLACPTGTVCMSTVHEQPVYACVASCDCSNCGTCDASQFTGYQRSCGSNTNDLNSATVVCNSPCPHATDGCLPYGQFQYCFPNEGCASAPPK